MLPVVACVLLAMLIISVPLELSLIQKGVRESLSENAGRADCTVDNGDLTCHMLLASLVSLMLAHRASCCQVWRLLYSVGICCGDRCTSAMLGDHCADS